MNEPRQIWVDTEEAKPLSKEEREFIQYADEATVLELAEQVCRYEATVQALEQRIHTLDYAITSWKKEEVSWNDQMAQARHCAALWKRAAKFWRRRHTVFGAWDITFQRLRHLLAPKEKPCPPSPSVPTTGSDS